MALLKTIWDHTNVKSWQNQKSAEKQKRRSCVRSGQILHKTLILASDPMTKIRFPVIVARRKGQQAGPKQSFFFIAFIVMLALIAGMSLYGTMHLHDMGTETTPSKVMSTAIKRSEEQLVHTAERIADAIDRTSSYVQHKLKPLAEYTGTGASDIRYIAPKPTARQRLAYAITITKDGNFQDGAAVLAYSIMKYARNSTYDISLIAFVHPNVSTSRPGLQRLGFHVIEVPTPVNTSAIRFTFLREKIDKNGCCGAAELIKLTSYRLLQYHRVIHLDADTIFLNPIDELYTRNYSLIYTTDPNMASYKGEDKMPVQGGFIVMRPSDQVYRDLIHVVMNTEFAKGSGWNRTRIGWFWGGMTVQGVLPYYYNRIAPPGLSQIVDRCYYNTMADTEPCSVQQLEELKSAHFTVCQKPWACWKQHDNRLCNDLHRRWFDLRREAEAFYGIPVTPQACPRGGHKWYKPMALDQAVLPLQDLPFVVPDDSLDRYVPIDEARYIGDSYNR